jgi:hypothetical protein
MPARATGRYYYIGLGGNMSGGSNNHGGGTSSFGMAHRFSETVTITHLGAWVTTLLAASNFQIAIYARSAAGRATGPCLAKTSNISSAAVGGIVGAITGGTLHSGGQATLPAGDYVFLMAGDTSTGSAPRFMTYPYGVHSLLVSEGAVALANMGVGNQPTLRYNSQTYGTWPDMTTQDANYLEEAYAYLGVPIYKVA